VEVGVLWEYRGRNLEDYLKEAALWRDFKKQRIWGLSRICDETAVPRIEVK